MHHLHGVMAHVGNSLDGVVYGQGDPISILEDELTGDIHHVMRVLSLSSPSVASPLTPVASISPVDSLRHDSVSAATRSTMSPGKIQTLQPANSSLFVRAHTYEPLDQGATADRLDLAGPPHDGFHSLFNNDYAPWKSYPREAKASVLINPSSSDLQVNYMRVQSSYDCSPEAPRHERGAAPNQASQTWTHPTAMSGYDWQGQITHPYPDTVPSTQSPQANIPRFHDSVSFPPDPTQHYQMMSSLQSYQMSRAQGGQSQAPSPQGSVLQNHRATFYRAAEHTMDLTDVSHHGAHTRLMSTPKPFQPHSSRNSERSESEPKPTSEEQALRTTSSRGRQLS